MLLFVRNSKGEHKNETRGREFPANKNKYKNSLEKLRKYDVFFKIEIGWLGRQYRS